MLEFTTKSTTGVRMATVLFIHGLNVRQPDLQRTLEQIEQKLAVVAPDSRVKACAWGDELGARLHCSGRSIPNYIPLHGQDMPSAKMEARMLWLTLYDDPLFEMRMLANGHSGSGQGGMSPGFFDEAEAWTDSVRTLAAKASVAAALATAGMAGFIQAAIDDLLAAPEFRDALPNLEEQGTPLPLSAARALVATMTQSAEAAGLAPIQGKVRDELVGAIQQELGGAAMGVLDWVTRPLIGLAKTLSTRYLQRNRSRLSDLGNPVIGDLICYQGRGAPIRQRIAEHLRAAPSPVVVVAHSLGGVAVVDTLLLEADVRAKVAHLHTVGSQAGMFYEIDGLVGMPYTDEGRLPHGFPSWTNFYDKADMLSYLAAPIFGPRVTDVELDSAQPFPQSHSAYWTSDQMWSAMSASLRA
jgi:hypothetical protein